MGFLFRVECTSIPLVGLDYRQTYTVYLLIDVEGKHVGHTAYIVDNGHDARLQVVAVDVVLAAKPTNELLAVELLGVHGSLDEGLHERFHNLVTAQFDVENGLTSIDSPERNFRTMLVSLIYLLAGVADEAAFKGAVEDLVFMFDEGLYTLCFEQAYGTGAHVDHLFVGIGKSFVDDASTYALLGGVVEVIEQQLFGLSEAENL